MRNPMVCEYDKEAQSVFAIAPYSTIMDTEGQATRLVGNCWRSSSQY